MLDAATLTQSLTAFCNIGESKVANAFTKPEQPTDNANLQAIIGDPNTFPLSWSAQFKPTDGERLSANPRSPLEGDEIFFSGMFDGARFMDLTGQYWDIANYQFEGGITIINVWYPRIVAVVSLQDIRRSIHSWVEPFLQRVPPAAEGIDYGILRTKESEANLKAQL